MDTLFCRFVLLSLFSPEPHTYACFTNPTSKIEKTKSNQPLSNSWGTSTRTLTGATLRMIRQSDHHPASSEPLQHSLIAKGNNCDFPSVGGGTHSVRGRWACVSPAVSRNTWWPVSQEAATSHQSGTTSERRSPIAAKKPKVYICIFFVHNLFRN